MRDDHLVATYRVQLTADWGLNEAAQAADYLAALGVSHVYTSPCLQAVAGSTHGYDVVDPTRVNEELGGRDAFARFGEALKRSGLGWVLDIVPNHMAVAGRANPWWWDVLEDGRLSPYAVYFDIFWQPTDDATHEIVLVPVLGEPLEALVQGGAIELARDGGRVLVRYYEHAYPLSPKTLAELMERTVRPGRCPSLIPIGVDLRRLPRPEPTDRDGCLERHRMKQQIYDRLDRLCREEPNVAVAIDAQLANLNADRAALARLLDRQNYRLAFWRTSQQRVGYRRFFDIDTLVGLRVEEERVFEDVHRTILEWVREGRLDGLRVDHIDGLADPQGYLDRLAAEAPETWRIVEKILEPGESLRTSWPVHGTTGYDFLNMAGGLFIDPAAEGSLTEFYQRFTGRNVDPEKCVADKKRLVLRASLAGDVKRLAELLNAIASRYPAHRDRTMTEWADVLVELIAAFPVYRTYVCPERGAVDAEDLRIATLAVETVQRRRPDFNGLLLSFIRELLTLKIQGPRESAFVTSFQQLTGPAMAKGVEDTVCYCFNRLVALNEVGGDVGRFGVSPTEFHAYCAETRAHWPRTMLADSTHDTKRSLDVRARLDLLSEMAGSWAEAVDRWAALNARHRRDGMPDPNDEYLFYQTLVGAWPIDAMRMTAYMHKAAREAKVRTSWQDPQSTYEEQLQEFVVGAMGDEAFKADVHAFVAPLIAMGRINALAQTLLKLTAPGVPDIYQGSELWDLSLVDPDNRRPVDYAARRRLLDELRALKPEQVWERVEEGLPKLWVIHRALVLRRQAPEVFGPQGRYEPLEARGAKAAHVVAFVRGLRAVTVVPRLVYGLGQGWDDTSLALPSGDWVNVLTDARVATSEMPVGDLFAHFPVALLYRKDGP